MPAVTRLAGVLVPELHRAEFCGLFTRLTDGSHRLAIVSTGLVLQTLVNVQRGMAAAHAANGKAALQAG